jgi:hypothetical protein
MSLDNEKAFQIFKKLLLLHRVLRPLYFGIAHTLAPSIKLHSAENCKNKTILPKKLHGQY